MSYFYVTYMVVSIANCPLAAAQNGMGCGVLHCESFVKLYSLQISCRSAEINRHMSMGHLGKEPSPF